MRGNDSVENSFVSVLSPRVRRVVRLYSARFAHRHHGSSVQFTKFINRKPHIRGHLVIFHRPLQYRGSFTWCTSVCIANRRFFSFWLAAHTGNTGEITPWQLSLVSSWFPFPTRAIIDPEHCYNPSTLLDCIAILSRKLLYWATKKFVCRSFYDKRIYIYIYMI